LGSIDGSPEAGFAGAVELWSVAMAASVGGRVGELKNAGGGLMKPDDLDVPKG